MVWYTSYKFSELNSNNHFGLFCVGFPNRNRPFKCSPWPFPKAVLYWLCDQNRSYFVHRANTRIRVEKCSLWAAEVNCTHQLAAWKCVLHSPLPASTEQTLPAAHAASAHCLTFPWCVHNVGLTYWLLSCVSVSFCLLYNPWATCIMYISILKRKIILEIIFYSVKVPVYSLSIH